MRQRGRETLFAPARGGSGPSSLLTGLVAYYQLDAAGGADATGRGNTIGSTAGSPAYAAGLISNALSVNGSSAIYAADRADWSIGARDFEITCWMNPATLTGNHRFIGKDNGSTTREYVIRQNATKIECFAWSGGTLSAVLQHTQVMSLTTWYFVSFSFVSATKTMSLNVNNGTAVATVLNTTAIDDSTAPFTLGASATAIGGLTEGFNGLIDEVGVWARTLTAGERTALYAGGAGLTYPF